MRILKNPPPSGVGSIKTSRDYGVLRNHPMVLAWIAEFRKDASHREYSDCHRCGFPHSETLLCSGAPFGYLYIGGRLYSVDVSNVEAMVHFREKQRPGFHWRDDIYFERIKDGSVCVTSFWQYNNYPQETRWVIDRDAWASIVSSVSKSGETAESWQHILDFHGTGAEPAKPEAS